MMQGMINTRYATSGVAVLTGLTSVSYLISSNGYNSLNKRMDNMEKSIDNVN